MAKQPKPPAPKAEPTNPPVEISSEVPTKSSHPKPRKVVKTGEGLTIEHY
jgi:hypothetical protein